MKIQKSDGSSTPILLVINKVDCAPSPNMDAISINRDSFSKQVLTCAVTGQGIENLEMAISELVGLNKTLASGRRWTVNQVTYSSRMLKYEITSFLVLINRNSNE